MSRRRPRLLIDRSALSWIKMFQSYKYPTQRAKDRKATIKYIVCLLGFAVLMYMWIVLLMSL